MSFSLIQVKDQTDIHDVASLAKAIWSEHFTPIIGHAQVLYMLDKFQSPPVIHKQLSSGYEYYLAKQDANYVGYMALVPAADKMMISKIYTDRSTRGQGTGTGKAMLNFVEEKCAKESVGCIWLTVNKDNADSVAWYKRQGFTTVDSVNVDIGNGFYMDDFIMEKELPA